MEFTLEEKQFLINVLNSLTLKASDKEALKTITLVQGIVEKLI